MVWKYNLSIVLSASRGCPTWDWTPNVCNKKDIPILVKQAEMIHWLRRENARLTKEIKRLTDATS